MKFDLKIISISILFIIGGAYGESSYFVGKDNQPLKEFNYIGEILAQFYGVVTDGPIKIYTYNKKNSRFNCKKNEVFISKIHMDTEKRYHSVLGHEASHLALCRLTNKTSILERFRFFDEGLANIMESRVKGEATYYKKVSLNTAKYYLKFDNLSIKKAQVWTSFFCNKGSDQNCNYNAYRVGSSFNFFIIDQWGKESLYRFFNEVGSSRSLSVAVKSIFDLSIKKFEMKWFTYILSSKTSPEPIIVDSYPKYGAKEVPIDIREIYIKFSVPMRQRISLKTDCKEGVCYKNAYWKTADTIAIKILKPLQRAHTYRIQLGYKRWSSQLESADGVPFPLTWIEFNTGK